MTLVSALKRIHPHVSGHRMAQFCGVLLLMLAGAAAEMISLGALVPFLSVLLGDGANSGPAFLAPVYRILGSDGSEQVALHITLLFGGAVFVAGLIRIGLTWASNRFVYGLGNELAARIYKTILLQPYSYHLHHASSEVLGSIGKIQLVVNNVIFHAMRALISLTIGLCILVLLMLVEPVVAFSAAIGVGSVFICIRLASGRLLKRNSRVIAEMQSQRVQAVQEGMGGIRDVLLERAETTFAEKFERLDRALQNANAANFSIARAPRYAVEAIGMIIIALIAYSLVDDTGGARAALPTLGLLALGAQRLLPLMQDLYQAWASIAGNRHSARDVVALLELPISPDRAAAARTKALSFAHTIALDDVSFHHQSDNAPIIRDLSLTIDKGTMVGLVGKTGSGKSTLVDLVMGLLTPTQGQITVDGQVLSGATVAAWQKNIAHVPQTIFLLDASIAENIAFGVDAAAIDPDKVRRAATQAQISDFIDTLADGYGTRVGENGVRLSGGQKQRIGIARALYKEAALLVLDEATSALDQETERAVMNAVQSLSSNLTIIVIAHRLSTLAACDEIVRLEDGRIAGRGSYATMVNSNDNTKRTRRPDRETEIA